MKPSVLLAINHFHSKVLPRKIQAEVSNDNSTHGSISNGSGKEGKGVSYRRAHRDEDGGELFSLQDFSFHTMALFGLGVSVYLIQLCVVALLIFISGCILLPSVISFASSNYGENWNYDIRLFGSAACSPAISVENITLGCDVSEPLCSAYYRENCEIPETTIIVDIVMCCVVMLILFFNMGIDEIEDILDEAIQSAQDYSVVVTDPDDDAIDPEEWKIFFERYGRVKNITITKKNRSLHKLLLAKHLLMRKIDSKNLPKVKDEIDFLVALNKLKGRSSTFSSSNVFHDNESYWLRMKQSLGFSRDIFYYVKLLCIMNRKIELACQKQYAACRVFVSFETEKEQRLCLKELSSSHMDSLFDMGHSKTRSKFRGKSVLNVTESAEPNNIQWLNLENSLAEIALRRGGCWTLSFGIMAAAYVAISYTYDSRPHLVSLLITAINVALPTIFIKITAYEAHVDEDDRQNSLLFKLYGAKLLTSILFPYLNTSWRLFLDSEVIASIVTVQLSACFSGPIYKVFDPFGVFYRWIVGPLCSTSQSELNRYWEGSAFMLADRYTEISKLFFMAFFYSLITPFTLFYAVICCLLMFLVDRFLLFRKTKIPPMLDASMAKSLREHALFALAVKLWLSCRFIYSWPMDNAYKNSDGVFVKVNKAANLQLWSLGEQIWHSESQQNMLITYKWIAISLISIVVFIIIILPFADFIKDFFHNSYEVEESATTDKEYSRVAGIVAYCPVIQSGTESFIIADTSEMLERHMPETIICFPTENKNLGILLKDEVRSKVLARVVWYGDQDTVADLESNNTNGGNLGATQILSSAFSRRFGSKKATDETNGKVLESNFRLLDRALQNKITIIVENDLADVAHINMKSNVINDRKDETLEDNKHDEEKEGFSMKMENLLGMSRIKKSIILRGQSNKVGISPIKTKTVSTDGKDGVDEKHIFMRDEVYMLRQMRKEMLSIDINVLSNANDDSSFVDFNSFLIRVQKASPNAFLNPRKSSQVVNLRDSSDTKNQNIKFSRTLLRRIFVKFIPLQKSLGSMDTSENLVNWPVFVVFVQSGSAVELAALA